MARTKKETTGSNPVQSTIEMMVLRPARIQAEDINTWREAVNSAKRGYRTKLYNLYENLMADPVLSDAIDKRVNAITNAEIAFLKQGKSVEIIEDLIDTPEFEELISEIVLHKAWGKSVIDVSFYPEFNVFSVPRKHIRIDKMDRPLSERKRYILEKESDMTGYDYENDPYIIECGKDNDLGFIFKAAPYVIYKRGGFGDWAQFAEIFGMPFLVGKYNGYDPKAKERLFQALSEIGSNPRAAIPKETELEVTPNKSSSSNTLYKDLKDACNEEILIAVLGNTMTTLSGSSRAQAEVHRETQEDAAKSDRRYVQRMLNRKLVPLLQKRGYPVAGGFFSFPDAGESVSTQERLEMALKVRREGIPVDDDYFYEITGIPKATPPPAKKEKKKEPPQVPPEQDEEKPPEKKNSKLKDHSSGKRQGGLSFFAEAPEGPTGAATKLWANLKRSVTGKIELADGYSVNISRLFNQALKEIYGNGPESEELINENLFNITNNAIQQAFTTVFSQNDWGKGNPGFVNEFQTNGAVFAAFKNHDQTKKIISLLSDENGDVRSFYEFKKLALQESEKYNVNWLRTEYNTAVRSAQAAMKFRGYLKEESVYPNLEYMESMASHKRIDHEEYVGTILPVSHEWWNTHLPPSDWNCQCWVRQTRKAATAVPDETEPVNPVFANNPGASAKFINTEETQYYKNTDEALRMQIAEIAENLEKLRQDFKLYKEFANGGKVYIHNLKNKKEHDFKLILSTALEFAKKGNLIKIATRLYYDKRGINDSSGYKRVYGNLIGTKFEGKCPDLIVNENYYEVENYISPFTKDKVSRMLSHGLKQSSKVIINNTRGASDRYIRRLIYARLENNTKIDEVWLYEKGKLRLLYKTQQGGT